MFLHLQKHVHTFCCYTPSLNSTRKIHESNNTRRWSMPWSTASNPSQTRAHTAPKTGWNSVLLPEYTFYVTVLFNLRHHCPLQKFHITVCSDSGLDENGTDQTFCPNVCPDRHCSKIRRFLYDSVWGRITPVHTRVDLPVHLPSMLLHLSIVPSSVNPGWPCG